MTFSGSRQGQTSGRASASSCTFPAAALLSPSLLLSLSWNGVSVRESTLARLDPDSVCRTTLVHMQGLVRQAVGHPSVTQAAKAICDRIRAGHILFPYSELLERVFSFTSELIEYCPDEKQVSQIGKTRELLIAPWLQFYIRKGDCDDFSMFVASLLIACHRLLGVANPIMFVAVGTEDYRRYNHVFVEVYETDRNRWFAVDCSHGNYMGWRVPRNEVLREMRIYV